MDATRILHTGELAALWRTTPSGIYQWRAEGTLGIGVHERKEANSPLTFTHDAIDQFQRDHLAHPEAGFPTVAELLELTEKTGLSSLVKSDEAAARLGRTASDVLQHLTQGNLRAFRAGQHWRFPLIDVVALAARMNPDGAIAGSEVAQILGVKQDEVRRLSKDGTPLERVAIIKATHEVYISEASLIAYLDQQLRNCTATEWREMRAMYGYEPLLTIAVMLREYHTNDRTIAREIASSNWPILLTYGRGRKQHTRIPRHVAEQWDTLRRRMPVTSIAHILGAAEQDVAVWIEDPKFCNLIHGRRHGQLAAFCPARACMRHYLERHSIGMSFDPDDWLARCLQDHTLPVSSHEMVATTVGLDDQQLEELLAGGVLPGVRLPDGTVALDRASVSAYRRRAERLHDRY